MRPRRDVGINEKVAPRMLWSRGALVQVCGHGRWVWRDHGTTAPRRVSDTVCGDSNVLASAEREDEIGEGEGGGGGESESDKLPSLAETVLDRPSTVQYCHNSESGQGLEAEGGGSDG